MRHIKLINLASSVKLVSILGTSLLLAYSTLAVRPPLALATTIPSPQVFNETGSVQTFTAPLTGTYKLQVWGAQGGVSGTTSSPGKGGYSEGTINLNVGQIIYVYVGGQGASSDTGGWNGGGSGLNGGAGGGGATDIRTTLGALNTRVIVGGAGGGDWGGLSGGYGGGLIGGNGQAYSQATGGTQISGGTYGGTLGVGGSAVTYDGGGGGGGYYGGGSNQGQVENNGGGGGSGYIGGVTSGQTIAGDLSMPTVSGGTETGQLGNGVAEISYVTNSTPVVTQGKTTVLSAMINSGSISLTAPIVTTSFPHISLDGSTQTEYATLSNWSVIDSTGYGDGWNVEVSATQLTEAKPSSGFASGTTALTLPQGSLSFNGSPTFTASSGSTPVSSTGGPVFSNTNTPIDTGSQVKIIDTQQNYGLGTYQVVEPTKSLALALNPSTTKVDTVNYPNAATPYETTITFDAVSGP